MTTLVNIIYTPPPEVVKAQTLCLAELDRYQAALDAWLLSNPLPFPVYPMDEWLADAQKWITIRRYEVVGFKTTSDIKNWLTLHQYSEHWGHLSEGLIGVKLG